MSFHAARSLRVPAPWKASVPDSAHGVKEGAKVWVLLRSYREWTAQIIGIRVLLMDRVGTVQEFTVNGDFDRESS